MKRGVGIRPINRNNSPSNPGDIHASPNTRLTVANTVYLKRHRDFFLASIHGFLLALMLSLLSYSFASLPRLSEDYLFQRDAL